ncbi:unnamed protein product [Rotaria sordida]|uniref:Uncharacterized protein n=2 Tax=Rotaria sordida TaxID=392033 RepID=A0A814M2W9_9BILA|nr:unnamed protein product [Rotaria sordida]CAF1073075.1 unnamed protein product [Rotaria sordida]
MLIVVPKSPLIDDFLLDPYDYYVDDPRDDKIDDESFIATIGAIISIRIGYMATNWTPIFWNKNKALPILPLPIIAYAILIDTFMQNFNSDIC